VARGIAKYWIVDPVERQITVCTWIDGQYEDQLFQGNQRLLSAVMLGLTLPVEQIVVPSSAAN
jgi:Uma2 family endonuclease